MIKYLVLFTFLLTINFAAELDNKLVDATQNSEYFKEIQKQIIEDKSKNKEQINLEQNYLKRLKELSLKKISIEEFNVDLVKEDEVNLDLLFKVLNQSFELSIKEENQNNFLDNIQDKLAFFKKNIENISDNKKDLLIYQLQYAYYKIQKTHTQTRVELLNSQKNKILENIVSILKKEIKLLVNNFDKELILIEEQIKKSLHEKTILEINLETEIINENNKNIELIQKNINKVEKTYQELLLKKINIFNKKIIISFINKDETQYLKIFNEINTLHLKLNSEFSKIVKEQNNILKQLAKEIFGNTKLLLNNSISQTKDSLLEIKKYFTSTLFVFNEQAISLFSLIKSFFLIIIGFILGFIYKKWIYKISTKWPNMSQMSLKISANVGYYLIILVTFMIAMSSLGIDLSSISLIAGALSIGIGFGLQTVVSNFIAGIILMFERTIRIGDIIEISDLLKGTVTDIRIRSTTIKTFDNIDIVIPNSSFIQNNVINWTLEDATRRLHISFGVAYGTKIEKVKEVILKELESSELVFIKDDKDKEPSIRLENMNTSSVDLELLVWVKANERLKPNSIKSDFLILIYNTLYKHNIEIPFPQLDLHLKK